MASFNRYLFQSTSSIQRKTGIHKVRYRNILFQSTSSIQRKTFHLFAVRHIVDIFQSTSSIQRKTITFHGCPSLWHYFNPLPLYRGRQEVTCVMKFEDIFQSTSSIQRKTFLGKSFQSDVLYFNPLPLYRGRPYTVHVETVCLLFQSTSSIQRKTLVPNGYNIMVHISIHFLYTEEDLPPGAGRYRQKISIHFLYTEEDYTDISPDYQDDIFQSTSSIQRKTKIRRNSEGFITISIHFLYTEEDTPPSGTVFPSRHFNPLPLYRGRPQISTNEYPSSRHFISNFDIKAIILSTRFSKLSYV